MEKLARPKAAKTPRKSATKPAPKHAANPRVQERAEYLGANALQSAHDLLDSERGFIGSMRTIELIAMTLDRRGRVRFCNDYLLRLLGCKREELVGQEWFATFLPHSDRTSKKRFLDAINFGRVSEPEETSIITGAGEQRIIRWNHAVLRDRTGGIVGLAAIGRDVTERRKVEANLAQSNSLLQAALDSTADGILVVDLTGKVSSYNKKFLAMWNLDEATMGSREDERALQAVKDQLVNPEQFLSKIHNLYAHTDAEDYDLLIFKDGRTYERYSRPQLLAGRTVGRVWSFRDVTERKRAEEAVLEMGKRFATFLDHLPGFAWIRDLGGAYPFINRPMREQLLAGSRPEGGNGTDRAPRVLSQQTIFDDKVVVETGAVTQSVEPDPRPGSQAYMLTMKFPILGNDGKVVQTGGIAVDVTNLRKVEEELKKGQQALAIANKKLEAEIVKISEEERRRFGQDMHDAICQHLTGISLLCSELSSRLADADSGEVALAKRIDTLLGEALREARGLAAGLHPVEVDSRGLVAALEDLVRRASRTVPCCLHCSDVIPDKDEKIALGLYRIAQEAVANCLKHAHAHQITVDLRREGGRIVLSIADDGTGIPSAQAEGRMGVQMMHYRARMIGAELRIRNSAPRGTLVTCSLRPRGKIQRKRRR